MKRHGIRNGAVVLLLAAAWALGAAPRAAAQVNGIIERTSGTPMQGALSWRPSERQYQVRTAGTGAAVSIIPLNQVSGVRVQPPATLEPAVRAARAGQANAATVAALETIVKDYLMLEHDLTAARWLGELLLRQGKGVEAARMFDRVLEHRQVSALPPDGVRVYWNALLEAERFPDLRRQLKWGIEEGPRPVAAAAQLLRGEMDMRGGRFREALVEGFLRTVVLFQDVRDVQPEALYKASLCFEELGESQHAEKMRKKLLAEFPDSSYTRQIHSGG